MSAPLIKFPQGPLIDQQTQRLSLEWFMFIQSLNSSLSYVMQQVSAQAGFASTMLSMAEEVGADQMMASIPGPQGAAGPAGARGMPGMDGQDGEDVIPLGPMLRTTEPVPALATYAVGAVGFDTTAHASELHACVMAIRTALVDNGLLS